MGNCIYCGQKAGFLRSKHKECEANYKDAKAKIIGEVSLAITKDKDFASLEKEINSIATKNHIKDEVISTLYTKGFDKAVESFLDDGILSIEEEEKVAKFKNHFDFSQEIIDKNGSFQKVLKSSILREITNGHIPEPKIKIQGNMPFILQKGEILIWIFQEVDFYEQRTKTVYHGKSAGVSIKIAKGVYYRVGSFKGNPVKIDEMKYINKGLFALTNKNIYFSSFSKSVKVPFNKIISIEPYEDGIGIHKDGASSKPQIFKGIDGWFTYNLISNLGHI